MRNPKFLLQGRKSNLIHESKAAKRANEKLASQRALHTDVIGILRRFKNIADRYRNRSKRFGRRFNEIAGNDHWETKSCVEQER